MNNVLISLCLARYEVVRFKLRDHALPLVQAHAAVQFASNPTNTKKNIL